MTTKEFGPEGLSVPGQRIIVNDQDGPATEIDVRRPHEVMYDDHRRDLKRASEAGAVALSAAQVQLMRANSQAARVADQQ